MHVYPSRNVLLGFAFLLLLTPLCAQTATCTNSLLSGTYFYTLNGSVIGLIGTTQPAPYAELGEMVADGQGNITGSSYTDQNGALANPSLSGTYTVTPSCAGSMSLSINSVPLGINFQVVDGGRGMILALATPSDVVVGGAYRAVIAESTQCGNGSFAGNYGYLLNGMAGGTPYSEEGELTADGNGNLTVSSVLNRNGTISQVPGTGSYSLSADCSGTAAITDQFGTHNYRIALVLASRFALLLETDAGTIVTGRAQPETLTTSILPDVVSGGGFSTTLYFTNHTDSAVGFPVSFIGDDGNAITMPSIGVSTAVLSAAAQGTAVLELPNSGALVQGYALVVLPAGVTAYGVFRKSATGVSDQEAFVPFSNASTTTRTLAFDDVTVVTAVAIVNPSSVATVVSVTARDLNGSVIGTSSVSLEPYAKTEAVLRNLPGLSGIAGHRGSVVFSVTMGSVAVLGLRFDGAAFTSVPTTNQ
jgi:hypothetical protein